jgi:hypothetical protein
MIRRGRRALGRALAWSAIVWSCSLAAGADDAPEIYSLSPDEGPAGTKILLKGRHLEKTIDVGFAAGWTIRRARFQVLSDRELEVIAPSYLKDGTAATVAVITNRGMTVGVPPDAVTVDGRRASPRGSSAFCHVTKGGRIHDASGISLIEAGGMVDRSREVAMNMVKRGGALEEYGNGLGVVFYERGAYLGPKLLNPPASESRARLVAIREIRPSPGIAPFLFRAPDPMPGRASRAPDIRGIAPLAATYGDIITLSGAGFTATTDVYLYSGSHLSLARAGFQVVSDHTLKVQVPDEGGIPRPRPAPVRLGTYGPYAVRSPSYARPQLLIVVNPIGATVTVPATFTGQPIPEDPGLSLYAGPAAWAPRDHEIYYITAGAVEIPVATLVFLKDGSRLTSPIAADIFCEPDAVLPDQNRDVMRVRRVRQIEPSPLRQLLVSYRP